MSLRGFRRRTTNKRYPGMFDSGSVQWTTGREAGECALNSLYTLLASSSTVLIVGI